MSKLGDRVRQALSKRLDLKDVIEQFGGVVTLDGIKEVKTKNGPTYVFHIVEGDNLSLWGSASGLKALVKIWTENGTDSLETLDNEMKVNGQRIHVKGKSKNDKGEDKWDIDWVGEVQLSVPIEANESDEPDVDEDTGEVTDGVTPF